MGLSAAPTPSPMSGMGIAQPPTMMTAGAAGQHRQEDEDQHFTPEFLVSLDNGNELVGPLPKVSPPSSACGTKNMWSIRIHMPRRMTRSRTTARTKPNDDGQEHRHLF